MGRYDDIIDLPHYRSKTKRAMSAESRAAQFSSFAALSGHEEALAETARVTDCRVELSLDEQKRLSVVLNDVLSNPDVPVLIRYFVPDAHKAGGAYFSRMVKVRRLESCPDVLVLADNSRIPLGDIVDMVYPD